MSILQLLEKLNKNLNINFKKDNDLCEFLENKQNQQNISIFIDCVQLYYISKDTPNKVKNTLDSLVLFFKKYDNTCTIFTIYEYISVILLYSYNMTSHIVIENNKYISRTDYILTCSKYAENLIKLMNYDCKDTFKINLKNLIFHIFSFLELGGLVNTHYIIFEQKKEKIFFYKINISRQHIKNKINVSINKINFFKKKNFCYYETNNFFNLTPYIHYNKTSNTRTIVSNTEVLEKLVNQKFFIGQELLKFAIDVLFNIFQIPQTLDSEEYYNYLIKTYSYFHKNKKILDNFFNRLLHIKYMILFLENYSLYKNGFFYYFYFDFRGRVYSDSYISFSQNAYIRYILDTGEYNLNEYVNFILTDNYKTFWEFLMQNSCFKNKQIEYDFEKYFIINCLLELGKIIKSKDDNYVGFLSEIDFLKKGLVVYKDEQNKLNLKDIDLFIKKITIYKIQNSNKEFFKKYFFFKDATASGLQILGLILKPKNNEIAKWLNFENSNYWYDTYYYIIENFLKKNNIDNNLKAYFNRKNLKKTIMIFNYQGSLHTCMNDFLSYLPKDINERLKSDITKLFVKFYNYLGDVFNKTEFFQNPSDALYQFLTFNNSRLVENLTKLKSDKYINKSSKGVIETLLNVVFSQFIEKNFLSTQIKFKQHNNTEDSDFVNDKNRILLEIEHNEYKPNNFIKFLKKYNMLTSFKSYYKNDKVINALCMSKIKNYPSLISENIVHGYLNYLTLTNSNSINILFQITYNDGFIIIYDYVTQKNEKIDIKYKYNDQIESLWKQLHIKHNLTENEIKTNLRTTIQYTTLNVDIDLEKLQSSFKANFIHSVDAFIIRNFIKQSAGNIITIHDCFGCDLINLDYNTSVINNAYNCIALQQNNRNIIINNRINNKFLLL